MTSLTKVFFGVCATALLILLALIVKKDGLLLLDGDFYRTLLPPSDPYPSNGRPGFQVDTPGCQIPDFDPFDITVRPLYAPSGRLGCSGPPPLVTANRTHLVVNMSVFYRYYGGKKPVCTYRKIWRKADGGSKSDDRYSLETSSHLIRGSVRVDDEFYYVECASETGKVLYRNYHPFVTPKKEVEARCEKNFQAWRAASEGVVRERLSVVIVGIDSVSRLNMLRHLPKTYTFLRQVVGAVELHGFNKVADNTFLNVVPLLTGQYVGECWNETLRTKPLDYLSLVWKDFSARGYRTLFGEDAPDISTFNYLKAGFQRQPTDYYLRPFTLATERSVMRRKSRSHCFLSEPETKITLDWLADFLETFQTKPTFSYLFNSRLTHDYLNYAGYADTPYLDFFKRIHSSGVMNHSIVAFFSDHGIRFGKIRDTYVGKLEERLPFFFLAFPPWFADRYPVQWRNLRLNERRLVTPFDIYATLREVLNFTGDVPREANVSERGISLFAQVPPERTCEDASILPHWCTCYVKRLVTDNDEHAYQAARHLVTVINDKLQERLDLCSELSLDRVVEARVSTISDQILRFKASHKEVIGRKVSFGQRTAGVSDYLLTVQVSPSGGVFEGTVRYFESGGKYRVMGDVSRINVYGNQSACVSEPSLRKFCYCTTT